MIIQQIVSVIRNSRNDEYCRGNPEKGVDPSITARFSVVSVMAMTNTTYGNKENTMQSQVTVEEWVARFRAIGLDDAAMQQWHRLFEQDNPAGHQNFLEWLGLPPERVAEVRSKYN